MANDKTFKVKNGLVAQRYLQSAGTETAGSVGYSLAGASYDGVSFSVAAKETNPQGLFFKPDGTKFYIVGSASDTVHEYTLSTAWDLSTTTFTQSFSVSAQDTAPQCIFFKPDGTKMYITGSAGDDVIEYSLSTAWNISTSTFTQSFVVSTQDTSPIGLFFKPDGTKMYIVGQAGQDINEYDLSTAWNISTASYLQNFSVSAQDTVPRGLFFKPDGLGFFVVGAIGVDINEYSLTSAWDISTASYVQALSTSTVDTNPATVFFNDDGSKMYLSGMQTDNIRQYSTVLHTQTLDLSTGTYFSFTPSGATTVSFTNPPASGLAIGFAVEINGGGSAITWPASVKWHEATAPTATATKEIYTFITTDGGTTYYGKKAAGELA